MIFIEEGNCETRNMSGEWCTDCKEYDHARHFCPRFDRVIAEAVAEVRENAKEERRGKWLRTDGYPHHIYCSECFGTYIPNDEWEIWKSDGKFSYRLPRDYCPNCGADMREERNEE